VAGFRVVRASSVAVRWQTRQEDQPPGVEVRDCWAAVAGRRCEHPSRVVPPRNITESRTCIIEALPHGDRLSSMTSLEATMEVASCAEARTSVALRSNVTEEMS
jgi:hypothetical protein